MIHECNLVKVEDCIQLMRDGNYSSILEMGTDDLLHELICFRIHTVSYVSKDSIDRGLFLLRTC